MLDAAPGTSVDVVVSGRQADEALDAIAVLFEDGFGEEC
jgi:phosphotransferase system HPr-like phosphotransfer protein